MYLSTSSIMFSCNKDVSKVSFFHEKEYFTFNSLISKEDFSSNVDITTLMRNKFTHICVNNTHLFLINGSLLNMVEYVKSKECECLFTYPIIDNIPVINPDGEGVVFSEENGNKMWKKDGKFHREGDLPAVIQADGTQIWYINGKFHREGDLPARIWANGTQEWYINGKCHREGDLPAIIWADGTQEWYINGKCHREGDLPARIWANGTQVWYTNGKCHREGDLPAVIRADGTQQWFKNGVKYTPQPKASVDISISRKCDNIILLLNHLNPKNYWNNGVNAILGDLNITKKDIFEHIIKNKPSALFHDGIIKSLINDRFDSNDKWDYSIEDAIKYNKMILYDIYSQRCLFGNLKTTLEPKTTLAEFVDYLKIANIDKLAVEQFLEEFMKNATTSNKVKIVSILASFAI
jgi:antitoxin component YwqK of YwqJK toxin-antitoxin module